MVILYSISVPVVVKFVFQLGVLLIFEVVFFPHSSQLLGFELYLGQQVFVVGPTLGDHLSELPYVLGVV